MRKLLFFFALLFIFMFNAHAQSPQWVFSTGVSPIPRSYVNNVMDAPTKTINVEWMNRIGIMINDNTSIGLSAMLRYQDIEQETVHTTSWATEEYTYKAKNLLWGAGPYMTRYFSLGDRFQLEATAFGLIEHGKGDFTTSFDSFSCPSCGTSNYIKPVYGEIERLEYKEKNYYAGLEMGLNYFIGPRTALAGDLTILQYENYESGLTDPNQDQVTSPDKPNIEQSGDGFVFFTKRPVFHLAVLFLLN